MFKKFVNWVKGKDKKQEVEESQVDLNEELDEKKEPSLEEVKKEDEEEEPELIREEAIEEEKVEIEREVEVDKKKESEPVLEEMKKEEESELIREEEKVEIEKEVELDEKIEQDIEYDEAKQEQNEIKEVEKVEEIKEEIIVEDIEENVEAIEEEPVKKEGFFSRLKSGLSKTRKGITEKIDTVLSSYRKIDEELFEDLEEVLITADVGINTTLDIIEKVKQKVKERKITEVSDIKEVLKEEMKEVLLQGGDTKLNIEPSPSIILVVGVNGAGKTTTIGKLSSRLKNEGKKVLIAAGDTFRAAAIEQLEEWSKRSGVEIISHQEGADPAAVIYDGIQAAKARKSDVLICDTAGRLHNKKNLMNELNKIFRVVEREYPDAKKEVLLVVDATTGQNAILQAKTFKEACDITGIVLTKLDGTAKGGVVIGVQSEIQVPVKLVGVGEKIDDLQDFDANDFINAIFEE